MTTTTEMTSATEVLRASAGPPLARQSAWQLFWARFREDRVALFALGVIILRILIALFGGPLAAWITGHPNKEAYPSIMLDEFGVPRGPNSDFWFGADGAGRD